VCGICDPNIGHRTRNTSPANDHHNGIIGISGCRVTVRTFEQEGSYKDAIRFLTAVANAAGPAITRSNPEGTSGTGLGRSCVTIR
jgi:hypothetical protein